MMKQRLAVQRQVFDVPALEMELVLVVELEPWVPGSGNGKPVFGLALEQVGGE